MFNWFEAWKQSNLEVHSYLLFALVKKTMKTIKKKGLKREKKNSKYPNAGKKNCYLLSFWIKSYVEIQYAKLGTL